MQHNPRQKGKFVSVSSTLTSVRKEHIALAAKAREARLKEIQRQKELGEKTGKKEKSPFRVFEAGPGANPRGLLHSARKSVLKGKNREFDAADPEISRPDYLAPRRMSLRRLNWVPKNLKLERKSAIDALKAKPDNHYHIIFGSYFLNNITARELGAFIETAVAKLRPGGRMIFIQSIRQVGSIESFAKARGLAVSHRRLTDAEAERGPRYVALRSNPSGRERYLTLPSNHPHIVEGMMKKYGVTKRDELERPTLMIMKKKRAKSA